MTEPKIEFGTLGTAANVLVGSVRSVVPTKVFLTLLNNFGVVVLSLVVFSVTKSSEILPGG